MLPNFLQRTLAKPVRLLIGASLAVALSACGGGGGSPGTVGQTPTTPTTPGSPAALLNPTMTMSIVDGTGATTTALSGGQSATVRALVKDAAGAIVPNAIVTFTASDATLVVFTPESGSALTDDKGTAVITVKPAAVTSAGAVGITGTAVLASKTATATANISIGAAPLVVGPLAFTPARTTSLPAFNTANLSFKITSGGAPALAATGITLNSVCAGDGTATLVLGPLNNGTQSVTYTNNGCTRGTDTITVSIGNSSQTISLAVDAASIGTIQFVGSDLAGSAIVLKGSGGLGRKESALLTFRVLDQNNQGLAGVDVNFTASTYTGGLTVAPIKGTTDATGAVTTTVSSGTIPTPVRVFAEATRNGKTISGLSDTLVISTGLPIQKAMSLSADKFNIEGWNFDGVIAKVTVRMADQYGNPISDDTAVNFVTEGGAIGSSPMGACLTKNGGCTVDLVSQNFRPVNGRVTVMAYAQGLEDFTDANGDGQYSCTNYTDANGNPSALPYRPLTDICVSGGEPFVDQGDPFLDAGVLTSTVGFEDVGRYNALDGRYDFANGDLPIPYNRPSYNAAGNGKWGLNYISRSAELTFSGSQPFLTRMYCAGTTCRKWTLTDGDPDTVKCSATYFAFRLTDENNNPMPAFTLLASTAGAATTISPDKVPSTPAVGGTIHIAGVDAAALCTSTVRIRVQLPSDGPSKNNYLFAYPLVP
jgi:hypothetical protein